MGFSGGGSNILKPHKHNSLVLQDGGNLDFKNDTQADMAAGSLTQSDGVHLQELSIGLASQLVRVNGAATALEYYTPATPSTVIWELLDEHTATGTESTYTFTPSPAVDLNDYQEVVSFFNGKFSDSLTLQAKFNGGTEYHTTITKNLLGTITGIHNGSAAQIDLIDTAINNAPRNCQCVLHITKAQINATSSPFCYYGVANSPARATQQYGGGTAVDGGDTVTSIEWLVDTSSWTANTTINTFGVLKS
jgi:hypothetical protein